MSTTVESYAKDAPAAGAWDARSSTSSAVSWGAIFAGGTATAALMLILLLLGTGLGLGAVSPWAHHGVDASTFGVTTILWLVFTQIVAYGMGGYLAGRLRTKWIAVHTDEVFFRDTAHGFLAWAVASLVSAALLTSVIGTLVGPHGHRGDKVGLTADNQNRDQNDHGHTRATGRDQSPWQVSRYFVDGLFRPQLDPHRATVDGQSPVAEIGPPSANPAARGEIARVFAHDLSKDTLAPEDLSYLAQRIALYAGISPDAAQKRVLASYANLQATLRDTRVAMESRADKARRASSHVALWLFLALLVGAFVASLAATYGGSRRDA